ncbi:hypothetical protein [Bacillus sp. T33-2]|uniref:hypothetical protein n=1 Tax=Bacillus sp. T33-2 TaxID=2054168 RepID=UPI000C76CF51|nr:hypothetical protein [Bacillus sp. T33-2]PLR93172.1 hypothetical protein CVD19_19385 [Bacillus sp. T33-2]
MKDSFYSDFEQLITYLNESSNLNLLEQIINSYLGANQELSISKFVNFQLELSQVVGQHIGVIFHYFKNNNQIEYTGRYKEVFRRLENIKKRFVVHLTSMEGAMTTPHRLKGTLFSINDFYPHDLSITMMKFDNSYFTLFLDINAGMNLAAQLFENLTNKLGQGTNNIDANQFDELVRKFEKFSVLINEISQQKESKNN